MSEGKITADALLELTGTNREAKAYAFLYAAFRKTEISDNPVRDAIDCLTPFILPYLNKSKGQQVQIDQIQMYINSNFGFEIPLYAIEQLVPTLQKRGVVEYNRTTRRYVSTGGDDQFDIARVEIETDFDDVSRELAGFAASHGFVVAPPSGSWAEALIAFLKTKLGQGEKVAVNIKGALVDPARAEAAVVGMFISRIHATSPNLFDKLLKVYMGILVEEFISSVAEVGSVDKSDPVVVFYDTAVLLRLLGTSGRTLQAATEELTRYLQDLGFETVYLSGNEAEVAGIFDALVFAKDSGRDLEGETAEAIASGDIGISEIRMLQGTFPEQLARHNVFPAETYEKSALANAKYQIDEVGFSQFLAQQAREKNRAYGLANREHDAQYLGTIMRLRRGVRTKDLTRCGFLFVTSNKFLAQTARRYLLKERVLAPQHCSPMLSVGQVATIAWLMKDHKLVPEKAGGELLSNCFAAFRPDAEWFKYFREGIEKASGGFEELANSNGSGLTLQAARRIAQEESLGSAAIVRQLNMAEIISRAEAEKQKILSGHEATVDAMRMAAVEEAEAIRRASSSDMEQLRLEASQERELAVREAAEAAELATKEAADFRRQAFAKRWSARILLSLKFVVLISFATVTIWSIYLRAFDGNSPLLYVSISILGIFSIVTFANFLRMRFVDPLFDWIEAKMARIIVEALNVVS